VSSVIAGTISQPSRVHNLAYVLVGYAITITLIPSLGESGDSSAYLITIAIIGGFFGTFLFLVKPIEYLMKHYFRRYYKIDVPELIPRAFDSPYLIEAKGQIIGGVFFSLTCFIALANPNISYLTEVMALLLRIGLIAMGSIVGIIDILRFNRLKSKMRLLLLYYEEVEKSYPNEIYPAVINDLRQALARKDWNEAYLIEIKYNRLIVQSREQSKRVPVRDIQTRREMSREIYGPLFQELNRILEKIKNADTLDLDETQSVESVKEKYLFSIRIDDDTKEKLSQIIVDLKKYIDARHALELVIQDVTRDYVKVNYRVDIGSDDNLPNLRLVLGKSHISFIDLARLIFLDQKPQDFVKKEERKWNRPLTVEASVGPKKVDLNDFTSIFGSILGKVKGDDLFRNEKELKSHVITEIEEFLEEIKIHVTI
jgi:hypothetical protein